MFTWLRNRRRKKLLEQPFPASWVTIMEESVPHYRYLEDEEKEALAELVRFFLAEKRFEPCGGIAITDQIRVVIAAQACLLVLGLPPYQYKTLDSILVYPNTVELPPQRRSTFDTELSIVPDSTSILGLASLGGPVILVWDAVEQGTRHPKDGHNVVYHEFAHILDMRDGTADGTPILHNRELFRDWVEICSREFLRLQKRAEAGKKTLLDPYGSVHEAEFFAVATELFFDRPVQMFKEHPELYGVLAGYYRQDTAGRERRYRAKKERK